MKYLKRPALTLLVTAVSLFSFSGVAYAEQPRPLSENEAIIQQQTQEVEQKATYLQTTTEEIESLEQKKQALVAQLESESKVIDELKDKLEEKKKAAEAERKRLEEIKRMFVRINRYGVGSAGNTYAAGNCTWYAKSRRPDLPNNLGNANTWYSRAAAQGWNVGSTAKKGAVGVDTSGWLGHVVYVEGMSIDGQWVTISEMNYRGLYSMNTRTVHYTEFKYIYELD